MYVRQTPSFKGFKRRTFKILLSKGTKNVVVIRHKVDSVNYAINLILKNDAKNCVSRVGTEARCELTHLSFCVG